jgi:hypothetical protein
VESEQVVFLLVESEELPDIVEQELPMELLVLLEVVFHLAHPVLEQHMVPTEHQASVQQELPAMEVLPDLILHQLQNTEPVLPEQLVAALVPVDHPHTLPTVHITARNE